MGTKSYGADCTESMLQVQCFWPAETQLFRQILRTCCLHLGTTNPIESTFATIRLRHRRTKGSGSRRTSLATDVQAGGNGVEDTAKTDKSPTHASPHPQSQNHRRNRAGKRRLTNLLRTQQLTISSLEFRPSQNANRKAQHSVSCA